MKNILLIDDDELSRMLIREHLVRSGFDVTEAGDGEIGKKLYRANKFDLVITDIFMPQKEGIATINELMDEFPDINIIAISDGGAVVKSFDYLDHAIEMGAKASFQKPIDPEELITSINSIIS